MNGKYMQMWSQVCVERDKLQQHIAELKQALDEIQQTYQALRDLKYDVQAWCESSIVWDEIITKVREK